MSDNLSNDHTRCGQSSASRVGWPIRGTTIRVPILAEVAAGKPIDMLPISQWREIRPIKGARPNDRYAGVRVIGDSLQDTGILDGDVLIFLLTRVAQAGDLVIVLTPLGLTIKYLLQHSDQMVLLRGANSKYEDQIWDIEEVTIQGIVRRVERDL